MRGGFSPQPALRSPPPALTQTPPSGGKFSQPLAQLWSQCLPVLCAQAELRRQAALHSVLNIVLVFAIHLVSGFKSVISDSCGFKRQAGKPSRKLGCGVDGVAKAGKGLSEGGALGRRCTTTDGKTRKCGICAFCFSWLLQKYGCQLVPLLFPSGLLLCGWAWSPFVLYSQPQV